METFLLKTAFVSDEEPCDDDQIEAEIATLSSADVPTAFSVDSSVSQVDTESATQDKAISKWNRQFEHGIDRAAR